MIIKIFYFLSLHLCFCWLKRCFVLQRHAFRKCHGLRLKALNCPSEEWKCEFTTTTFALWNDFSLLFDCCLLFQCVIYLYLTHWLEPQCFDYVLSCEWFDTHAVGLEVFRAKTLCWLVFQKVLLYQSLIMPNLLIIGSVWMVFGLNMDHCPLIHPEGMERDCRLARFI